ncbi:MAG: EamA family transporter [Pseudomonadota bacterium]
MTAPFSATVLYALVLVAALAHASWNALIKRSDDPLLSLAGIRAVGLVAALLVLTVAPWPHPDAWPFLAGHALFIYVSYFFLLQAYQHGEYSTVYPIARGIAPMAVLLLSVLFGVDALSGGEMIATLIIVTGIGLFAQQKSASPVAVAYALGTGLSIAGYSLMAGLGVRPSGTTLGYLAASEALAALGLLPIAWYLRRRHLVNYMRAHYLELLGAGLLSITAFGTVIWVYNFLPIAPVSAVRESSVAFAVLIGVCFLGEALNWQKVLGLTLVISGTVSLALLV